MARTRLHRHDRGFEDHPSCGWRLILCSRCKKTPAYWLQKGGRYQRYYCDECVKRTAAWKQRTRGDCQ